MLTRQILVKIYVKIINIGTNTEPVPAGFVPLGSSSFSSQFKNHVAASFEIFRTIQVKLRVQYFCFQAN